MMNDPYEQKMLMLDAQAAAARSFLSMYHTLKDVDADRKMLIVQFEQQMEKNLSLQAENEDLVEEIGTLQEKTAKDRRVIDGLNAELIKAKAKIKRLEQKVANKGGKKTTKG